MSLQSIIQDIKTANTPGENTALRVGTAFEQMDAAKRNIADSLSKSETIDMVNSVKLLASTGTPFLGTIDPSTNIPAGNFWAFAGEGTYANAGGIVVGAGEIAIITRVGSTFDSVILDVPVKSIEDIEKTSTVGLVDTYTITYTDGSTPTIFEVTNGETDKEVRDVLEYFLTPQADTIIDTYTYATEPAKTLFGIAVQSGRLRPTNQFDADTNPDYFLGVWRNIPVIGYNKVKVDIERIGTTGYCNLLGVKADNSIDVLVAGQNPSPGVLEHFEFDLTNYEYISLAVNNPIVGAKAVKVEFIQSNAGNVEVNAVKNYIDSFTGSSNVVVVDSFYQDADGEDFGLAFNRAIASLPAQGGQIQLLNKRYNIITPVIVNKNVFFKGQGSSAYFFTSAGISEMYTNLEIDIIKVNKPLQFICEDIYFNNTKVAAVSEGSAIKLEGQAGNHYSSAVGVSKIQRCCFNGFYDNINAVGAYGWTISNCVIWGYARYGILVSCYQHHDAGDSNIFGNEFSGGRANRLGVASIYHSSSGGLRIVNNKFNGNMNYCYLGEHLNNETSILIISANSFENYRIACIKLTTTGVMPYRFITIGDNEFASYNTGSTDIDIKGAKAISIQGNIFNNDFGGATRAINLNSCTTVRLFNVYHQYSNPINIYNCTDVSEAVTQIPSSTNVNI